MKFLKLDDIILTFFQVNVFYLIILFYDRIHIPNTQSFLKKIQHGLRSEDIILNGQAFATKVSRQMKSNRVLEYRSIGFIYIF